MAVFAAAAIPAISGAGAAAASGISLATALSIASFALTGLGFLTQGAQARTASRFQADLLARQAQREREIAALEETEFRRRGDRLLATQRARLGASGVDFTGTALDVAEDTAAEIELQALKIRSGGQAREAGLRGEAAFSRLRGDQAFRSGVAGAGASFLRGGAKFLSRSGDVFG